MTIAPVTGTRAITRRRALKEQIRQLMAAGIVVAVATGTGVVAEQDANTVMAAARSALGGDARIASVRTLAVTGRTIRLRGDGTTAEHAFDMALEVPSRFVRRSVMMAMGPTSIYRHSGFDGDTVIEWIDTPPSLAGGGNVVVRIDVGRPDGEPTRMTPEQVVARNARLLEANQREFARLSLGLFAAAPPNYPLQFRHVGHAESQDGRADIVEVTGPNGFTVNLFVDASTRLPLMVSWQAPEPIEIISENGPGTDRRVMRRFEDGRVETPADAAADRPLVEHRLVFTDHKTFDGGVKLPTRLQRVIAGRTTEETILEHVRVNSRLDRRTFATGN
jgi:hypothetical protein